MSDLSAEPMSPISNGSVNDHITVLIWDLCTVNPMQTTGSVHVFTVYCIQQVYEHVHNTYILYLCCTTVVQTLIELN